MTAAKGNGEPSTEELTQCVSTRLFRQEVVAAREGQWLGTVNLPAPGLGWGMAALAASVALVTLTALAFGSVSRKERVQGRLVPASGFRTSLAPVSGTLINRLVMEGQAVSAGDALMEISSDKSVADSLGAVGQRVAVGLANQAASLQRAIAYGEVASVQDAAALHVRSTSLNQEIASASKELELRSRQSAIASENLDRIRPLQEGKILSEIQARQYEDLALTAERQRLSGQRDVLRLQRELVAVRQASDDLTLSIAKQRGELERQLAQIEQERARNQAQQSVIVRASGTGIVAGLAVSEGQAVFEGQRLLSIIPAGDNLYAELWVPSRAIGLLSKGESVQMRYDAFPYRTFGLQSGSISSLGGSPMSSSEIIAASGITTDQPAYRVLVALNYQYVERSGRRVFPRAGSTLEADLLLERRRLYDLLLPTLPPLRSASAARYKSPE